MKILDWYILKKYLVAVLFTLVLFAVIAVAIDASEKTDDFVKSGLSTYELLTNYWIGFVPFIISMIFPLMVFIAVIFFTSKLAGRSEIVAIIAGGVPYNRFLRPYFLGSLLLAGSFWYASQYLIPRANVIRGNFQTRYVDNNSSYYAGMGADRHFYFQVDAKTFVGMRSYDTTTKSARSFFLQRVEGNKVKYNLRAENITWDTAKKNWRLDNVIERKVEGLNEQVKQIQKMNMNLNLKPTELRRDRYMKDKLTTPELKEYIRQANIRGQEGLNEFKVERYKRDATSVSVVILTMIGAIIASRKTRGGLGLHLALGLMIGVLFFGMNTFSTVFSTNADLDPVLAAWLPNIIFTAVAIFLYIRAPK
ncbi:MAG TPA: LptF/LptG family permease [Chitinophagaceae bacterium]|nr:LptF/LptG family permease [Chitinophagaceae bacterium]